MSVGVRAVAHIRQGTHEPVLNVEWRVRSKRRRPAKDADFRPRRRLVVSYRAGSAARRRETRGNDAECCKRREYGDEQGPAPAELVRWLTHVTPPSITASAARGEFRVLSASRSNRPKRSVASTLQRLYRQLQGPLDGEGRAHGRRRLRSRRHRSSVGSRHAASGAPSAISRGGAKRQRRAEGAPAKRCEGEMGAPGIEPGTSRV